MLAPFLVTYIPFLNFLREKMLRQLAIVKHDEQGNPIESHIQTKLYVIGHIAITPLMFVFLFFLDIFFIID